MLLVSRWTLRRRVVESRLDEITGFSVMSDEQLDSLGQRLMRDHGTMVGSSLLSGPLRSLGLIRVQRDRIRESAGCVDLDNSAICWAVVISDGHILWSV